MGDFTVFRLALPQAPWLFMSFCSLNAQNGCGSHSESLHNSTAEAETARRGSRKVYFCADYKMKKTYKMKNRILWIPLLGILAIMNLIGCSSEEEQPSTVTLEADKTSIKANGRDSMTFVVKVDGRETTTGVTIRSESGETVSPTLRYAAEKVGSQTFYAVYKGTKSNAVTVTATQIVVTLNVDRTSIRPNATDQVRFTVLADDEDVTSSASILRRGESETKLEGTTFSTDKSGDYTFYATYHNERSAEVAVHAAAGSVTLRADRSTIYADGNEAVTFTVTADGRDVTSNAVITRRATPDATLTGHTFTTTQSGDYTFYATYDGVQSAEVRVKASALSLNFAKQHCIMQFSSSTCSTCPIMTTAIDDIMTLTPGRAVPIVFHVSKLCFNYPELYGVLSETADRLCPAWPSALVDMHTKVNVYRTATREKFNEAIWILNSYAPAQTGIALRSSVEGGTISFTADVAANKTGEYRFFAYIVEDGIKYGQRIGNGEDAIDPNYVHNNVATYPLTATDDPRSGLSLGTIERGKHLTRTYTIDTRAYNIKRNVDLSRCRVVAYTLRLVNGSYTVDNVATCPVSGGSVSFRYAK